MTAAREPTTAHPRGWGSGLARAAVLVAAVTVAARAVGFGRWLVFSKTVGDTCLGDAYNTANQLPNVAFEIVAGGALASVVVPLLAGVTSRSAAGEAARTLSALLTWTLLVLTPVTVLAAALAGPYAHLMLAGDSGCGAPTAELAARMLVIFAPQMWFYGVAVVVSGALQAQRRFLAAALAPLASSLVVIAAYAGFAAVAGGILDARSVPDRAVAVLAGGTSLGVVAMALTVLVAFARAKGSASPMRPALRFPPGVASRARRLAAAGMLALIAQQLVALVLTWLANHRGEPGTLTLYTWAYALFTLPYAVLVVPVATTVFPHAAALASADRPAAPRPPDSPVPAGSVDEADAAELRRLTAGAVRTVVLLGALGGALLAGTSTPLARLFVLGPGGGATSALAGALTAFAPAVPALGLVTLGGRLLYARGNPAWAAWGTAAGWLAVAAAAVFATAELPAAATASGLGTAMSLGLLLGAVVLLVGVRRATGPGALRGLGLSVLAGSVAATASAAVGRWTGRGSADGDIVRAVTGAALAGLAVTVAFAVLVALLMALTDRDDLLSVSRRLSRFARRRTGARDADAPGGRLGDTTADTTADTNPGPGGEETTDGTTAGRR
ncbi:murein biosynthesis integral membrane protein MurJ [Actinopolymorpha singaporensis]|uniref:Putative peptidoglycan lipid II flippase n=1 Tax=Actinopolymorpha singaporensis TaxID=117157 RepID=A0A1H1W1D5_9ACTN|nr:lipid II flippase MurJ [Actinopolymorpha singaporensis]SDS91098.1 putative peptidoglycan lipid II flippase [Actinopolymorpha singaporensis]